jgi:hypothetical protein
VITTDEIRWAGEKLGEAIRQASAS